MLFDLNLKVLSLKFLISSASSSMVAKQVRQKVHNDRSGMHTKEEWGKRYVSWWWLGGGDRKKSVGAHPALNREFERFGELLKKMLEAKGEGVMIGAYFHLMV